VVSVQEAALLLAPGLVKNDGIPCAPNTPWKDELFIPFNHVQLLVEVLNLNCRFSRLSPLEVFHG